MLTVIIPTKNHPEFLDRLLGYFEEHRLSYPIRIGDSSEGEFLKQTSQVIQRWSKKLQIFHHEYADQSVTECHQILSQEITTPYSVCVSDGAFLIPKTLQKAVQFLEENQEYTIAHGKGLTFSLKQKGPYGTLQKLGTYSMPSREESTALERLKAHFECYRVTMYCVMRANVWKTIWKEAPQLRQNSLSSELLPCFHSILTGKVKELEDLYIVRQRHATSNRLPSILTWFLHPEWSADFSLFCNILGQELTKQDKISPEEALKEVRDGFLRYLGIQLGHSLSLKGQGLDFCRRKTGYLLSRIFRNPHSVFRADLKPLFQSFAKQTD